MVRKRQFWSMYWWEELIPNTMKLKLGEDNVKDYVDKKLKEVYNFMQYRWDKVFPKPQETRADKFICWVIVGTPFLITGLVLLMLICCCRCCRGRRSMRMTKARGRNSRMLRDLALALDFVNSRTSLFQ